MFLRLFFLVHFVFSILLVNAQTTRINAMDLQRYVAFLASDSLKGRKPGTPEMEVASQYIKGHFQKAGLKLLGEDGFQWFDIVADVKLGKGNKLGFEETGGILEQDFIPLSFSSNGSVAAPVVFAGYGFDIKTDSLSWDDYHGLDVAGKWVLIFSADPELDNPDSRFIPYSDIRSKILTAKDHQAAGILIVVPQGLEKEDKLMPLVVENNEVTSGLPVVNVTRKWANALLISTGWDMDSLERTMVREKAPHSLEVKTVLRGSVDVVQKKKKTANVVALLESDDPLYRNEYLVVGGHYDHLGMGGPGSGSRMPDTLAVHNGADDNASGTAMVMALSDVFSGIRTKLKRSIIFITFSAEEMGLIGSKYFVSHSPVDLKKIMAMFNFDMVGRFDKEKNSIVLGGTGTSAETDSLLNLLGPGAPFHVVYSPEGYGPSDHASFYAAGIPVFYFSTGVHTDYHTPFDDTGTLDFESQKMVGDYAASVVFTVDTISKPLTYKESGKKASYGRGGRKLKVTLGIMPDFAGTEKKGLRVDGVTPHGPADKGGMKKGDVITGIDGLTVGNIYEYMARLKKFKPGMRISVEIIRNEKPQVLIIEL